MICVADLLRANIPEVRKSMVALDPRSPEPVIAFGRAWIGEEVVVDSAFGTAVANHPVVLDMKGAPLRSILASACRQARCDYDIFGPTVLIAPRLFPPDVIVANDGIRASQRLRETFIDCEYRQAKLSEVAQYLQQALANNREESPEEKLAFRVENLPPLILDLWGCQDRRSAYEILVILTRIAPIECVIGHSEVLLRKRTSK